MQRGLILATLAATLIALMVITPRIGLSAFENPAIAAQIFHELRLPRVFLAFLVGAGLAVCGLVYQAIFHNPLSTPFTLGVASGASLGAALSVYLGISVTILGISGTSWFAFLGAVLAISIVYGLSQLRQQFSTEFVLLTGVAVSFFFSSLILLIHYLSDVSDSFQITRWLMGQLTIVGYGDIWRLLPVVGITLLVVALLSRELNLLMAGDEIAASRGVAIQRVRYILFGVTSLCVGVMVALCGPIGFVGMMVPHMCRLLMGHDHRYLVVASTLMGGGFLMLCDTLARWMFAPVELPVGIITTLLGGPFFLWLLIRSRTQRF